MTSAAMTSLLLAALALAGCARAQQDMKFIEYFFDEEQSADAVVGDIMRDARLRETYGPETADLFRFRFLDAADARSGFAVDERTGVLHTTRSIDRERDCARAVTCKVVLKVAIQPVRFFQIIEVTVNVVDVNDNWPAFGDDRIALTLPESAPVGSAWPLPIADDRDSGANGVARYELVAAAGTGTFGLGVGGGEGSEGLRLELLRPLDREVVERFTLTVVVWDGGQPAKSGRLRIDVTVGDVNDNRPRFVDGDGGGAYEVTVAENVPAQTAILRVRATDADAGENGRVTYRLARGTLHAAAAMFGVDATSGDVYVRAALDYARGAAHTLTVVATDGGRPPLSASRKVVVRVRDLNDHAPVVVVNAMTTTGRAQVPEDADAGTFVAHLAVSDGDAGDNGAVTCELADDLRRFHLQPLGGAASGYKLVTTAGGFDLAARRVYNLTVVCRDGGTPPQTAVQPISVLVTDVNDHCPEFGEAAYAASVDENSPSGAYVTRVTATDADEGDNAAVTYRLSAPGGERQNWLDIDAISGVVRTRVAFDHERRRRYALRVVAADQGEPACSVTVSLTVTVVDVNDHHPVFAHSAYAFDTPENEAPGTTVGVVLAVDGDSPPYDDVTYSLDVTAGVDWSLFAVDWRSGVITTTAALDTETRDVHVIRVLARNDGHMTVGAADVTVRVTDRNDHAPVIDFPDEHNTTVDVPSGAGSGQVVTRVEAHDVDRGRNAALRFSLAGDPEAFDVNPQLGVVVLRRALTAADSGRLYRLLVVVADDGRPPLSASVALNVYVNDSLPAAAQGRAAPGMQRANLLVVVCLAVFLLAFVVAVVVVLLALRHRRRRRRRNNDGDKYNCRVEAAKAMASPMTSPMTSSPVTSPPAGERPRDDSDAKRGKKEVSFKMDADDDGGFMKISNRPIVNSHVSSPIAATSGGVLTTFAPPPPPHRQPHSPTRRPPDYKACGAHAPAVRCYNQQQQPQQQQQRPANNNAAESSPQRYVEDHRRRLLYGLPPPNGAPPSRTQPQVHSLMAVADADGDSDGGSLTDSGRGPSEEGEGCGHHRRPDPRALPPGLTPTNAGDGAAARSVATDGGAKKAVTFNMRARPNCARANIRHEATPPEAPTRHSEEGCPTRAGHVRPTADDEPDDSPDDASDDDTTTSGSYVVDLNELLDCDQTDCKYDVFV